MKYFTKKHLIIECISYGFLVLSIIYALVKTVTIKTPIPTHYDFAGNVDGYGSAATLLILPGIMLFTNLMISLSVHLLPISMWNMPMKVNPGREPIVYGDMILMNVLLQLELAIFTLVITILFVNPVNITLGVTAVYLAATFATIIALMIKAFVDNKN